MQARITLRQCVVNREKERLLCERCKGLVDEAGEVIVAKTAVCKKCKEKKEIIAKGLCRHCYDVTRPPRRAPSKRAAAVAPFPLGADTKTPSFGPSASLAGQYEGVEFSSAGRPAMVGGVVTDSANDSHLKDLLPPEQTCSTEPLSALLPPPETPPAPPPGVFPRFKRLARARCLAAGKVRRRGRFAGDYLAVGGKPGRQAADGEGGVRVLDLRLAKGFLGVDMPASARRPPFPLYKGSSPNVLVGAAYV